MNTKRILIAVIAILCIAVVGVGAFAGYLILNHQGQQGTPTPSITSGTPGTFPTFSGTAVATGMPYVQGSRIIDGSGHPFLLCGTQIESPFNILRTGRTEKGHLLCSTAPSLT